jgi:TonB family protein
VNPPADATVDAGEPPDPVERLRASLDAESIQMVVRHHLPQIQLCYDRALKQRRALSGLVEVRFTLSPLGRVLKAEVERNTTGHEGLGECIAFTMRSWRFPRPVAGEAEFIYPFQFSASSG